MIFRIRLPRLEELLGGLEEDSEKREDQKRPPIIIRMPPNWECSCTCSALNVNTTWNIIYNPIIFI